MPNCNQISNTELLSILYSCISLVQVLGIVLNHLQRSCHERDIPMYNATVMQCINMGEQLLHDFHEIWLLALDEGWYYFPRQLQDEYYIKVRCIQYFYYTIEHSPRRDPLRFQKSFRVLPDMFYEICELVRPDLETNPPDGLRDIPNRLVLVHRQVALSLVRLAFGMSQLNLGNLFGLSQPTVSLILWKFVKSFIHRGRHFLQWPEGDDMDRVKMTFLEKCGFPNCCGAIDGTHILITRPPNEDSTDYFDRNKHLSLSVQAITDYQGRFLDLSAGWPGSFHDTRMLINTKFYHAAHWNHTKLVGPSQPLHDGTLVREYILGDSGYPCLPWLIVPFHRNQGIYKERFNTKLSKGRLCVERAFGRLKGTWRILDKRMNRATTYRLCRVIYCCALLHNMILSGHDIPAADYADGRAHPEGYPGVMERNQAVMDQENPTRTHLYLHLLNSNMLQE